MFKLRDELVKRLELLPNVKVAFWKDTDLLCVLHKDKEVAHFQNGHEIDIRLTPAIIKKRKDIILVNAPSRIARLTSSPEPEKYFEL